MTDATARRIRIESALDTDRKTHALHHTRIYIGDEDITNDVIAIDWHADATSAPTATIQIYAPGLEAEALEAAAAPTAEPTALRAGMTPSQTAYVLEGKLDALAGNLREFIGPALQQLQQTIVQAALACATCLHEERTATRQGHNLANTIIDGTAYCNEHLDDINGRLVPRKTSGLIITGA